MNVRVISSELVVQRLEMLRRVAQRVPPLVGALRQRCAFPFEHRQLRLQALFLLVAGEEPDRKDLRWQLDIGEDLVSPDIRQLEFRNWLRYVVQPRAAGA